MQLFEWRANPNSIGVCDRAAALTIMHQTPYDLAMLSNCRLVFAEKPPTSKQLRAIRKEAGWSTSRTNREARVSNSGAGQWVSIVARNTSLGVACLTLAPPEFCFVSCIVTFPRSRGIGAVQPLARACDQHCNVLAIRRLILEPTPDTKSFYASLQFQTDPLMPSLVKKDLFSLN